MKMHSMLVACVALLGSAVVWAQPTVSIDQLLSRKGLSCDVRNAHLTHLSQAVVGNWRGFDYQYLPSRSVLMANGIAYEGIQAAEVLSSANGRQLALGVNRERFGLRINRVAINLVERPYESFGYYWVAEGSPAHNKAALNALFGNQAASEMYVTTTASGNTRVNCVIAG